MGSAIFEGSLDLVESKPKEKAMSPSRGSARDEDSSDFYKRFFWWAFGVLGSLIVVSIGGIVTLVVKFSAMEVRIDSLDRATAGMSDRYSGAQATVDRNLVMTALADLASRQDSRLKSLEDKVAGLSEWRAAAEERMKNAR